MDEPSILEAYPDQGNTPVNTALFIPVLDNDLGVEEQRISLSVVITPTHGTTIVTTDNQILYSPEQDFYGLDGFDYQICGANEICSSAGVTVTVEITGIAPYSIEPLPNPTPSISTTGSAKISPGPAATITSTETFTTTLTAVSDITDTPSPSATEMIQPSPSPTATIMPATAMPEIAQAPVAGGDFYQMAQGSILAVSAPGLLMNDSSPEVTSLIVIPGNGPVHGQLDLYTDGSFVYTPHANFSGIDSFDYILEDGFGGSSLGVVTIEVLDFEKPVVEWTAPVAEESVFDIEVDTIELAVTVMDAGGVEGVWFYRWDAQQQFYVEIDHLKAEPYQTSLDASRLAEGWNQIFVRAYDRSGNLSDRRFIWIYKASSSVTIENGKRPDQNIFLPELFH